MTQTPKNRREVLEQFVRQNPDDAFARYGLALECVKLGDDAAAMQHFEQLLAAHPEYLPTYYQFGQLLARVGKIPDAKRILTEGIVAAQKAGDMHARDETQAALDALR